MGVTKKPGGKERKTPSGSSSSIQSRTELERKLEKLLRDNEWIGEELRIAVNKISPLLELNPSKQALSLIEHSIKEKQLMPPSKSASIDLLVYELSDIEKRRHQNPRFDRHVSWVYKEMNKWKDGSKDFLGDVIESVADLARLHVVPRQVLDLVSDVNTKLVGNPHINRYFNYVRKVAKDFSEFRREPHPWVYRFIKTFLEKDPLCAYSDKYKYFTHIPRSAPKELLFIISRGLTRIGENASESPEALTLLKVVEETSKIYERYTETEIEEFFGDFDFSEEEDPMDVVRRLHDDLVIKRMAKSDVVSIVDKSIENIEKEENVRLYTRDMLKEIESRINPQEASKFSDTLKVFEDLGVGPRMIDITRLLANHMLGRSNDLEDKVLAAMIQEASKAVNDARQEKREIDTMAKGPGPKKCSRAMRKAFMKEHGIDVKYYWDLRPFQLRLYNDRRATLSYLALTETELDKQFYLKPIIHLRKNGMLKDKLMLIDAGCGNGLKSILMFNVLQRMGYDVHAMSFDTSTHMRDIAALNYFDNFDDEHRWVPVYNIDLEGVAYHKKLRTLSKERQKIFFIGGNLALNLPNIWGVYSGVRDLFMEWAGLSELYSMSWLKRLKYKIKNIHKKIPTAIQSDDILITEADLKKEKEKYESSPSVDFLKYGIDRYVSRECIVKEDGTATLTIMADGDMLRMAYVLTKDYPPFEKGQAIIVIDSGKLNEPEFEWWMNGVGFDCMFFDRKDSTDTMVLSRLKKRDKIAARYVDSTIKTYEKELKK